MLYNTGMKMLFLLYTLMFLLSEVIGASVHRCGLYEYWHTVLETCRPCSDVCDPLDRPDCQELCYGYYLSILLAHTTPSSTVPGTRTNNHDLTTDRAPDDSLAMSIMTIGSIAILTILCVSIAVGAVKKIFPRWRKQQECRANGNEADIEMRLRGAAPNGERRDERNARNPANNTENVGIGNARGVPRRHIRDGGADEGGDDNLTQPLVGARADDTNRGNGAPGLVITADANAISVTTGHGFVRPIGAAAIQRLDYQHQTRPSLDGEEASHADNVGQHGASGACGTAADRPSSSLPWSTRAVYDEKNKCIELKNMDKFPGECMSPPHSL